MNKRIIFSLALLISARAFTTPKYNTYTKSVDAFMRTMNEGTIETMRSAYQAVQTGDTTPGEKRSAETYLRNAMKNRGFTQDNMNDIVNYVKETAEQRRIKELEDQALDDARRLENLSQPAVVVQNTQAKLDAARKAREEADKLYQDEVARLSGILLEIEALEEIAPAPQKQVLDDTKKVVNDTQNELKKSNAEMPANITSEQQVQPVVMVIQQADDVAKNAQATVEILAQQVHAQQELKNEQEILNAAQKVAPPQNLAELKLAEQAIQDAQNTVNKIPPPPPPPPFNATPAQQTQNQNKQQNLAAALENFKFKKDTAVTQSQTAAQHVAQNVAPQIGTILTREQQLAQWIKQLGELPQEEKLPTELQDRFNNFIVTINSQIEKISTFPAQRKELNDVVGEILGMYRTRNVSFILNKLNSLQSRLLWSIALELEKIGYEKRRQDAFNANPEAHSTDKEITPYDTTFANALANYGARSNPGTSDEGLKDFREEIEGALKKLINVIEKTHQKAVRTSQAEQARAKLEAAFVAAYGKKRSEMTKNDIKAGTSFSGMLSNNDTFSGDVLKPYDNAITQINNLSIPIDSSAVESASSAANVAIDKFKDKYSKLSVPVTGGETGTTGSNIPDAPPLPPVKPVQPVKPPIKPIGPEVTPTGNKYESMDVGALKSYVDAEAAKAAAFEDFSEADLKQAVSAYAHKKNLLTPDKYDETIKNALANLNLTELPK